eukprot:CAMPEP_0167745068 /NCGR_PEP_ID=MMETSP0110_2-20121227/2944_1 /TAXON_ID=629695 /ORGANISM="Gymnochlora sp., Strain CCMP2014" /LENGTH=240 /DNA_ID=CAMNT_0007629665 /DNA_START=95 /DNA_END=817 /DNA_ORIENTATION=-
MAAIVTQAGSQNTCRFGKTTSPPKRVDSLSFCQQFRRMTCCNKTHTDKLRRRALAYFDAEVPDNCRNVASKVLCNECEPAMGTGERSGMCQSMCDKWYDACAPAMFTKDASSNEYVPCTFNSLLCWKLGDVVGGGKEFCEKQGMAIVADDESMCYDGQMHPKYKKLVTVAGAKAYAARTVKRRPAWLPSWVPLPDEEMPPVSRIIMVILASLALFISLTICIVDFCCYSPEPQNYRLKTQ